MKIGLLVLCLVWLGCSVSAVAAETCAVPVGAVGKPFCKGAVAVRVTERNAQGNVLAIHDKVTQGEPITFGRTTSDLVARSEAVSDAGSGHFSLTVSNIKGGVADSVDFDVAMDGKNPGLYEGRVTIHAETGTGSRSQTLHWVDGIDYEISLLPVASAN